MRVNADTEMNRYDFVKFNLNSDKFIFINRKEKLLLF